jgi:hypothetical protein
MTVSSTQPATPLRATPDPFKHVKFTYGMVLDAADFVQEHAYLSARDQWMVRDLIGYGTVSGLKVTYEQNGGQPRVVVAPGVGVTSRGQMVRVGRAQCAVLNEWLKGDAPTARAKVMRTSDTVSRIDVFITLCYRECETDRLPIPGEPCRDEKDTMAPSRVADDFRLELRLDAPEQPDERGVRDFVQWLSGVPIVDGPSSVGLPAFLDAIRYAATLIGSPPSSPPDFMYGVPPPAVTIGRADVCRYLRAAYRLWVVELREKWNASWFDAHDCGCDGAPASAVTSPDSCILLSRVTIPLAKNGPSESQPWLVASSSDPVIDDEDRPFLVPLRMLQEWSWCGCTCGADGAATAAGDGDVVAAGMATVTSSASPPPATGKYQMQAHRPLVVPAAWTAGDFLVMFKGYANPTAPGSDFMYVVSATPIVGASQNPRIEVAAFDDDGIRLRLKNNTSATSPVNQQLLIQVTRYAQ